MKNMLYAVILLLLLTGALHAQSTAIYTTASTDSAGYDRASTTANPPPSPYDVSWQTVTSTAMTNMSANDANRYETRRTSARYQYDSQLFRFKVTQDSSLITQFDPKWIGYGEAQATYPCYLYIWNRNTSSWQLIQQQDIGAPDGTLTGAISSNIPYYINSDGIVYVAAQAKHYNYVPTVTLSSPANGTNSWDSAWPTYSRLLSWTVGDADNDTVQSYAVIRDAGSTWTTNSGWIAGTSWTASPLNYGVWYYWRAQVRDGLDTSAFTSEWNFLYNKSSCPFLYVWDGKEYKYVTDIGGYAIGRRTKDVALYRPFYAVMGENITDKDGFYEFKIREILHEASFVDELELWVVESSEDYEIATSSAEKPEYEKVKDQVPPTPPPARHFYTIHKSARTPVSVIDEAGNECVDLVKTVDNKAILTDQAKELNSFIFDFGNIESATPKLVVDGWRYAVDLTLKRKGLQAVTIELMNNEGEWEKLRTAGDMAGDFKTMAIPLGDVFKDRKDHRIKLSIRGGVRKSTAFDRVRLDVMPQAPLEYTVIPVSKAELSFAGYATFIQKDSRNYRMMLKDDSNPVNPDWVFEGNFTRYGDVTELALAADDCFIIMNSGDQILADFKAIEKPLRKGFKRTFVLKMDHCYKSGDEVTRDQQNIFLLPYKGMTIYPYTADEGGYPFTEKTVKYLKEYNTRKVSFSEYPEWMAYYDRNSALKDRFDRDSAVPHSLNTNYVELKVTYSGAGTAPSIPVLSSPSNGSTGVSSSVTFRWTPSSGTSPITYQLQIATDSGFTAIVSDTSGISTDFYLVTLSLGTQYFWRVCANNAFGTSAWSSEWSFTTGSTPSIPSLVSPADISADIVLSPAFEWTASTGGAPITYTLQVDTENTFTNPITVDLGGLYVTSYDAAAVLSENTQYFWRIQASNPFGNSGWSSTWSFTTGTKPTTPSLSLPGTGSADIDMPVLLQWNAANGSSTITYTVQVDADIAFGSPDYNQGYIEDTKYSVLSLTSAQTYYWRVKAKNDVGDSSWSAIWSFTTSASATAPSIPVLSGPADAAADTALNTTLFWEASSGTAPVTYTVQIDTDQAFPAPTVNTGSAAWYQSSGLAYSSTYYWRVGADNSIGSSGWSSTYSFTTMADPGSIGPDPGPGPEIELPSIPQLFMPSNGAEDIDISTIFGWIASSGTTPIKYSLQIGLDQSMTQLLYSKENISSTFDEPPDLPYEMALYWRVKAVSDYGESGWSDTWSLTTKIEPASDTGTGSAYALIVTSPSALSFYAEYGHDNPITKQLTVFNGGTKTFNWTLQEDADWLTVNPSTGSAGDMTDIDVTADVAGLASGVHSAVITVTAQDAVNNPVSIPVSVYIYTDGGSTADSGGTGSTGGSGAGLSVPSKPALMFPFYGIEDVYPAPALKWDTVSGVTYWLQLSADQGFGSLLVNKVVESTEYQTSGMELGKTYFWRVKAVNSAGMSDWSDTWWFRMKEDGSTDTPQVSGCFIRRLQIKR